MAVAWNVKALATRFGSIQKPAPLKQSRATLKSANTFHARFAGNSQFLNLKAHDFMKLDIWRFDLALTHTWTIASSLKPDGSGGKTTYGTVFAELTDATGLVAIGESAP